ncbi:MAG: DUF2889 domain-containing protein [Alphaproteobacteria bacterium]|nr:DUF2889 domain-containing protein [Alphaproteobacteria bacterium]
MPLSPPAEERELLHLRDVTLRGYRRADGLFDIEGRVRDTKTYGIDSHDRGRMEGGDPLHDMWVRLTLDEDMVLQAIETVSDAFPYNACPAITPNFQRLIGLKIGPGWNKAVKERVGGIHGCTHLVELMGPLATAAFQTMGFIRRKKPAPPPSKDRPPRHVNTCWSWRADGPVVQRIYPDFYTGPKTDEPAAAPTEADRQEANAGGAGAMAEQARES